jgi:NADH-quinone oxidoreductase subunit M
MNVSLILIILLVGAFATYLVVTSFKVALFFGLGALAATIVLLNNFNAGENISVLNQWINKPSFNSAYRWTFTSHVIINNSFDCYNNFHFFENEYKNAKAFYALILFMAFAMAGTF